MRIFVSSFPLPSDWGNTVPVISIADVSRPVSANVSVTATLEEAVAAFNAPVNDEAMTIHGLRVKFLQVNQTTAIVIYAAPTVDSVVSIGWSGAMVNMPLGANVAELPFSLESVTSKWTDGKVLALCASSLAFGLLKR